MFNEFDIATTIFLLKKKAERTGAVPLGVDLTLPDTATREAKWRDEAVKHLTACFKARQMGKQPPSILSPTRRLEREYDALQDTGPTMDQLLNSVHEQDSPEA